jgi:malate dehydrogenase (oxaloacetate-decarboxylating)
MGIKDVVMCDRKGVIHKSREGIENDPAKLEIADFSNKAGVKGTLADALKGADIFIGVSAPDCVSQDMIRSMAEKPIVFPMANPVPEIMPEQAVEAGACVVGTGRSDYPNQINNVLAFPGIFRGALDVRASDINEEMKIAAARAIAELVTDNELRSDYIIPVAFDDRVGKAVSEAVAKAAKESGIARI